MKIRNYEIFEIHATYCRALASPKRLAIMACLGHREMCVGELSETLDSPLSTISRHLSVMRDKQLVVSRSEGTRVFYRPADARLPAACQMIRSVLIDGMKRRGELAAELDPSEIITED